ncbi:MAG: hypothetical protein AABX30_01070 [Nanoarchaeota archaeon]
MSEGTTRVYRKEDFDEEIKFVNKLLSDLDKLDREWKIRNEARKYMLIGEITDKKLNKEPRKFYENEREGILNHIRVIQSNIIAYYVFNTPQENRKGDR